MFKFNFFFYSLILLTLLVNGQDQVALENYYITWGNDTVYAEFKDPGRINRHHHVIVKKGRKKTKFYPDNIKKYKLDSVIFFSSGDLFLELVIQGNISLFKYRYKQQMQSNGVNGAVNYFGYEVTNNFLMIDDVFCRVRKMGFKKDCEEWFSHYPEVLDKIRTEEYKSNDLIDIVEYANSLSPVITKKNDQGLNKTMKKNQIRFQNPVVNFMNGKKLVVSSYILDSLDYYEGNIYYTTLLKNKEKNEYKDNIFSITERNGTETVLYKANNEIGEILTPDQMAQYIDGFRKSRQYKVSPLVMIGGIATGFGGVFIPSPTVYAGRISIPIPVGVLVPATYIAIMGATTPTAGALQRQLPIIVENEHYQMGYQEGVKKKRLKNSLLGAGLGFVAGIIVVSATN